MVTKLKNIACAAILAIMASVGATAEGPGTQRISLSVTTMGFCGVKLAWEYAVTPEVWVGAFYQASAVMIAQGDFNTGEVGASARWDKNLGAGFFAEAALEAGYRFQNQNLGFTQSAFSRQDLRAGYRAGPFGFGADLGWDQTWVTNIRHSDYVRATWSDRYENCAAAPESTTLVCPATVLRLGGFASATVADRIDLSLSGGWAFTPGAPFGGFDGMMFGHFPFYADFSVRVPY
jgi:hypothetical protein